MSGKTEEEKMVAGELYDSTHPDLVLLRNIAHDLCFELNHQKPSENHDAIFKQLFPKSEHIPYIEPPFFCDYGKYITFGKNVYMNFNCCILDVCQVTIGSGTLFGPNVQIYTACHPTDPTQRKTLLEMGKPISIGENCWIGGNVVILPGVQIGNNTTIGGGSVVTKNIPDNVVAVGNPARVIKTV